MPRYLEFQLSDSGKDLHRLRLSSVEKHMCSDPVHEVRDEFVSLATSKDDNKSHEEVLFFVKLEVDHPEICIFSIMIHVIVTNNPTFPGSEVIVYRGIVMHFVLALWEVTAFSSSSKPPLFLSFLTRLFTAFSLHFSSPSPKKG